MARVIRLCGAVLTGGVTVAWALATVLAAPAGAEPNRDGQPGHPGYNGAPTVISGHPAPTMNGVPCIGGNLGACVGFAQNQPQPTKPRSTVGHSPTVR